jgi:hypothetical protein
MHTGPFSKPSSICVRSPFQRTPCAISGTWKKLLQLLHADSTGSPTWFLDSCGATTHPKRRLLLTNYDVGVEIHGGSVQLGLNFAKKTPELFAGQEMGEDTLRVLDEYRKLFSRIRSDVRAELPRVRTASAWARRIVSV